MKSFSYRSLTHRLILSSLLCWTFLGSFARAAGDAVTDEQIAAVRGLFEESPDRPGVLKSKFQGKSAAQLANEITEDFAADVYKQKNILKVLQKLFTYSQYAEINKRLGEIRDRVNVEIWAEIADKYGIQVELNDAGKKNGAISDLDKFLFTAAERLAGRDESTPEEIYKFLVAEHERLWTTRMKGTPPMTFDVMHFGTHTLMRDWRMVNTHWQKFAVDLGRQIAILAGTEGAYFIPGGYKTQVYNRYHNEGKTTIIGPTKDKNLVKHARTDLENTPKGIFVTRDLLTREFSKLYKTIQFGIDRFGAAGSALQNFIMAVHTDNPIKNAKYNMRGPNTGLMHLTNLEVDFQRLILEGKTDVVKYQIKKLFTEMMSDPDTRPPNLRDVAEVQRVIEVMTQIELDKIIGQYKGKKRPPNWSKKWLDYKPQNINDPETKLKYYEVEAKQICMDRYGHSNLNRLDARQEAEVVKLAERAFRNKANAVSKVGILVATKRMFRDIFTRRGIARQQHLYGDAAAKRLLVERVKEIHAALIFIDDPKLINQILNEAPPEARRALKTIADIAAAKRSAILEHKALIESGPTCRARPRRRCARWCCAKTVSRPQPGTVRRQASR